MRIVGAFTSPPSCALVPFAMFGGPLFRTSSFISSSSERREGISRLRGGLVWVGRRAGGNCTAHPSVVSMGWKKGPIACRCVRVFVCAELVESVWSVKNRAKFFGLLESRTCLLDFIHLPLASITFSFRTGRKGEAS